MAQKLAVVDQNIGEGGIVARGDPSAQAAETQGLANSGTASSNASNLYSSVVPQLTSEALNPAGFDPTDLAAMNTGAQQSAGGTQAATVGQSGLLAARTKNSGAAAGAIDNSSRNAGEQLSKNALGVRIANANLKQNQQQAGIAGLTGLTGMETAAANNSLGEVANNSNANTNAANESWNWARTILDPAMQAAGSAAGGGAFGQL